MQVDILFDNAKVYNVDKKIDVVKGQKFTINTDHVSPEDMRWFSDEDQVLSILKKGASADFQALEIGTSSVIMVNKEFGILKELQINVVDEILHNAVTLGARTGSPVIK